MVAGYINGKVIIGKVMYRKKRVASPKVSASKVYFKVRYLTLGSFQYLTKVHYK